jgi:N6-adenosine-specific RNA methylase IME4
MLPPIYGTLSSTQIFKLPLQQTCESTTILWNLIFGVEMNDQLPKEILGQIT